MTSTPVIDFHAHWWPSDEFVHRRDYWPVFIRHLRENLFKEMGFDIPEGVLEGQFFDPGAGKLLEQMDSAGIDQTVLLPLDWGRLYGEAQLEVMEQNRACVELAQQHFQRIIPFFGIDPNRPQAERCFLQAAREWGVKGLKLYPPCGFYPWEKVCHPLYHICLDFNLPVVFHGSPSPMSAVEYGHPAEFEKLARQFPGLRIVIAHAGGLDWLKEATQASWRFDNIFLDLSGWQAVHSRKIYQDRVRKLFAVVGDFGKIAWGTDNPIFNGTVPVDDMVSAVQELSIPDVEKSKLLGGTARKILTGDD